LSIVLLGKLRSDIIRIVEFSVLDEHNDILFQITDRITEYMTISESLGLVVYMQKVSNMVSEALRAKLRSNYRRIGMQSPSGVTSNSTKNTGAVMAHHDVSQVQPPRI
jgi:hypothetical protein